MKRSTRQYAKRQIKWFKNKFLPVASDANRQARSLIEDEKVNDTPEDVIYTYVLDATGKCLLVNSQAADTGVEESTFCAICFPIDLDERWTSRVLDNAREITEGR